MSIFFQNIKNTPAIPFIVLDYIADIVSNNPEAQVSEVVTLSYKRATNTILSTQDCLKIVERLRSKQPEDHEDQPSEDEGQPRGKSMGSSYMTWVQKLDPDQLCLFLSDYDFEKALHLYTKIDYETVISMASLKQEEVWQKITSSFEASMYGFGGSYKGDRSSDDDKMIDLSPDEEGNVSDTAMAAIKSMGF